MELFPVQVATRGRHGKLKGMAPKIFPLRYLSTKLSLPPPTHPLPFPIEATEAVHISHLRCPFALRTSSMVAMCSQHKQPQTCHTLASASCVCVCGYELTTSCWKIESSGCYPSSKLKGHLVAYIARDTSPKWQVGSARMCRPLLEKGPLSPC